MNQRFDMIWFGRMGLNHEGKTATQGCEAKHGGRQATAPFTHFLALPRRILYESRGSEPRGSTSGRPEGRRRAFGSRNCGELFLVRVLSNLSICPPY